MYLVQHDGLHTVAQHCSKLSRHHRLAATLQRGKKPSNTTVPLRRRPRRSDGERNSAGTLAPIRHMSLVMCDCIISARSCDWLAVLMNDGLLWDTGGALEPAGT